MPDLARPLMAHDEVLSSYYGRFDRGVEHYVAGSWRAARDDLAWCHTVAPHDRPAAVLLEYMAESNFEAPANWRGFRHLTSK